VQSDNFSLYFINPLDATSSLDRSGIIALKLPQQRDQLIHE
jgi:hypothetical protein